MSLQEELESLSQFMDGELVVLINRDLVWRRHRVEDLNGELHELRKKFQLQVAEIDQQRQENERLGERIKELEKTQHPGNEIVSWKIREDRVMGAGKIDTIKAVRAILGVGLLEAKNIVEGQTFDASYNTINQLNTLIRDYGYSLIKKEEEDPSHKDTLYTWQIIQQSESEKPPTSNTISALKAVKKIVGSSLSEAKDAVEGTWFEATTAQANNIYKEIAGLGYNIIQA